MTYKRTDAAEGRKQKTLSMPTKVIMTSNQKTQDMSIEELINSMTIERKTMLQQRMFKRKM